ncbi:MAG: hypothetical protein ABI637_08050 [Gemmatimonadota bacterium]
MGHSIREARLKSEFAHLYPPLAADCWTPAAEVGARMLFWQVQRSGTVDLGDRLLDGAHFEFRGGWTRGDTGALRTRVSDSDAVHPEHPRQARA